MGRFSLISKETVQEKGLDNYLKNFWRNTGVDVGINDFLIGGYYQLGWDSYSYFIQQSNGFVLENVKHLGGSAIDVPTGALGGIVTRGVSTCTIAVIKIDNWICLMHLDIKPARIETKTLEITSRFLEKARGGTSNEIFIVFSYIESNDGLERNLTDAIEGCIRKQFSDASIRVRRIRRCTTEQFANQNITCHVEIGTAFYGGEAIVYGDVYKSSTEEFVSDFEIPLTKDGFIDGEILYNRDSGGGCGCIVM